MPTHPSWCSDRFCDVATGGAHRSLPAEVGTGRPMFGVGLAARDGGPVYVEVQAIGLVDVDGDAGALLLVGELAHNLGRVLAAFGRQAQASTPGGAR